MDRSVFEEAGKEFALASGGEWRWEEKGYLTTTQTLVLRRTPITTILDGGGDGGWSSHSEEEVLVESDDPAEAAVVEEEGEGEGDVYVMELHVVYHPTYSVPTLYFVLSTPSGDPLGIDALWEILPLATGGVYEISREADIQMTYVARERHPCLHPPRSMFFLHPCKTLDVLLTLLPSPNPPSSPPSASSVAPSVAPSILASASSSHSFPITSFTPSDLLFFLSLYGPFLAYQPSLSLALTLNHPSPPTS